MPNSKQKCKALLISCMDYRVNPELTRLMEELEIPSYDLVCLAGAAQNIAEPRNSFSEKAIWDQLGLSVDLHGIDTVVLADHLDCGAHGGRSPGEEETHEKHLAQSEEAITDKYPGLSVVKVIADILEDESIEFNVLD